MKKFRFKLQTLLEQRQAKEDELLAQLGELRREEAEELTRLDVLNWQLGNARRAMEKALRDCARTDDVVRLDVYVNAAIDDIKVQNLTIEAVRDRIEGKRVEVVEAMKERKVLETLRDKQEREYLLAAEKAEQNMLDEMSSVRYARSA